MRILFAIAGIASLAVGCTESASMHSSVVGTGFTTAVDAALLASQCRELTDEEIDGADSAPGCGWHNSIKYAEDADHWMNVGDLVDVPTKST